MICPNLDTNLHLTGIRDRLIGNGQIMVSSRDGARAFHRFGLGPKADSLRRISSDPLGALLAELNAPDATLASGAGLMTSGETARTLVSLRDQRQAEREDPASRMVDVPAPQRLLLQEAQARLDAGLRADIGFAERLVWFWSNHFCVSADKVKAVAGCYEREAIRPHVLGRFSDLLIAAESHPAMLFYLDNAQSFGPDSPAGMRRAKGLNENLAREILELHTLGVRTVYSQADVTAFAKVLTGWSIVPPRSDPEHGGDFVFNARMHEPGAIEVIGKARLDRGVEQGREVLIELAHHPATARHVATKLVRHFVADAPPTVLVDSLTKRFLDTGGDLRELAVALVSAPEAWQGGGKLKRPSEWIMASLRATGLNPDVRRFLQAQALLGEPLWRPAAPKGFSDDEAAWVDGIGQRLDIASQLARASAMDSEPQPMVDAALGSLASEETRQAVARAEGRQQAWTLLLMAPEFQRR